MCQQLNVVMHFFLVLAVPDTGTTVCLSIACPVANWSSMAVIGFWCPVIQILKLYCENKTFRLSLTVKAGKCYQCLRASDSAIATFASLGARNQEGGSISAKRVIFNSLYLLILTLLPSLVHTGHLSALCTGL